MKKYHVQTMRPYRLKAARLAFCSLVTLTLMIFGHNAEASQRNGVSDNPNPIAKLCCNKQK